MIRRLRSDTSLSHPSAASYPTGPLRSTRTRDECISYYISLPAVDKFRYFKQNLYYPSDWYESVQHNEVRLGSISPLPAFSCARRSSQTLPSLGLGSLRTSSSTLLVPGGTPPCLLSVCGP